MIGMRGAPVPRNAEEEIKTDRAVSSACQGKRMVETWGAMAPYPRLGLVTNMIVGWIVRQLLASGTIGAIGERATNVAVSKSGIGASKHTRIVGAALVWRAMQRKFRSAHGIVTTTIITAPGALGRLSVLAM